MPERYFRVLVASHSPHPQRLSYQMMENPEYSNGDITIDSTEFVRTFADSKYAHVFRKVSSIIFVENTVRVMTKYSQTVLIADLAMTNFFCRISMLPSWNSRSYVRSDRM